MALWSESSSGPSVSECCGVYEVVAILWSFPSEFYDFHAIPRSSLPSLSIPSPDLPSRLPHLQLDVLRLVKDGDLDVQVMASFTDEVLARTQITMIEGYWRGQGRRDIEEGVVHPAMG